MRVLSMADAHAMEVLVRSHAHGSDPAAAESAGAASTVLLELPTSEVVRLGLISNRGMLLVAAAFGVIAQGGGDAINGTVGFAAKGLLGWGRELHLGWLGWAIGMAVVLAIVVVALRILSVVLALLNFHGFTLRESGRRLSVQRGLLNRMRANMPRRRIQAWTLREGLTHRWLGRRGLRVDTATVEANGDQRSMRDLAPVIEPGAADDLVRHLLPGIEWPPRLWRRLHPRAWRRQFGFPAVVVALAGGVFGYLQGPAGFAIWALLPVLAVRAKVWAKHAAYSADGGLVVVREGWLDRHWRFAEVRKLQALRLTRSPFDRRHGMATLLLDTAGASPFDPPLRIRYLPEAEARELHDRLAREMERAVIPARTAG
jgi:putative membrane protein